MREYWNVTAHHWAGKEANGNWPNHSSLLANDLWVDTMHHKKNFLFVRYISWFYLCLWVTFCTTCQFYYNFIINRQGNERIISASTENIFLQIVKSYRKNLSCILFLLRNFLWRIIWRRKGLWRHSPRRFFFLNLYLPKLPSSWRAQSFMYSEFSWKSFVRYIL